MPSMEIISGRIDATIGNQTSKNGVGHPWTIWTGICRAFALQHLVPPKGWYFPFPCHRAPLPASAQPPEKDSSVSDVVRHPSIDLDVDRETATESC